MNECVPDVYDYVTYVHIPSSSHDAYSVADKTPTVVVIVTRRAIGPGTVPDEGHKQHEDSDEPAFYTRPANYHIPPVY